MKLSDLSPAPYNPRDITAEALSGLKASLGDFGDLSGITWNSRTGHLVCGHQRLRALQEEHGDELRMVRGSIHTPMGEQFKVREVDWPEEKERAANITANSPLISGSFTGELENILASLEQDYSEMFAPLRLDEMLGELQPPAPLEDDEVPEPPKDPVTQAGDVWTLGDHRLLCGDSKESDAVHGLVQGEPLDFIFSSPPYNVGIHYATHDDKTTEWVHYKAFLTEVLQSWLPHLKDGRVLGWNVGVSPKVHSAGHHLLLEELGMEFVRQLVWKKCGVALPMWHNTRNKLVARNFHPNFVHEMVLLFSKGDITKGEQVGEDRLCENDVFTLAQNTATKDLPFGPPGTPRTGKQGGLKNRLRKAHPAPFPIRLPAMFMEHLCDVGKVAADPFLGSGTTLIAAEQLNRRCFGIEIDPGYCDVIVERWENLTGGKATR